MVLKLINVWWYPFYQSIFFRQLYIYIKLTICCKGGLVWQCLHIALGVNSIMIWSVRLGGRLPCCCLCMECFPVHSLRAGFSPIILGSLPWPFDLMWVSSSASLPYPFFLPPPSRIAIFFIVHVTSWNNTGYLWAYRSKAPRAGPCLYYTVCIIFLFKFSSFK